jgi:hypothetical protein
MLKTEIDTVSIASGGDPTEVIHGLYKPSPVVGLYGDVQCVAVNARRAQLDFLDSLKGEVVCARTASDAE